MEKSKFIYSQKLNDSRQKKNNEVEEEIKNIIKNGFKCCDGCDLFSLNLKIEELHLEQMYEDINEWNKNKVEK